MKGPVHLHVPLVIMNDFVEEMSQSHNLGCTL